MNAEIKEMTEEQIADLETQIKEWRKAKERKRLAWKPKIGELYFAITTYREGSTQFINTTQEMADVHYSAGNCFRTEGLVKAELKRRQVKRQIEELIDKYDSERGGAFIVGEDNFQFYYEVALDRIFIKRGSTNLSLYSSMLPCFSSREVAERMREEIGEDNIKLLFAEYPIVRGE